jgi:transposase
MLKTLPDLSRLTHAQKDELIIYLFGEVQKLIAVVEAQDARIKELEARLGKNSSNSSKPPSSDGLSKAPKSLRKRSGKKVGGQAGHKGETLRQVTQPDETIILEVPTHCMACGQRLEVEEARIVETRQVFDIPSSLHTVTAHCAQEVRCSCGHKNRSDYPDNVVGPVQYGSNIKALAVYLTQEQMLPFARASELIKSLYGLCISPGTLVSWVAQAHRGLTPVVEEIAQKLSEAAVVCADESGLRVDGKLYWLHTAVTEDYTWYGVHAKRGIDALTDFEVLTSFKGVLVHDCWKTYWQLNCSHALCNAHVLRELVAIEENTQAQWAKEMQDLLYAGHHLWCARGDQPIPQEKIVALEKQYTALLEKGFAAHPPNAPSGKKGRPKQSDAHNLLCRLRDHQSAILRFLREAHVPFTNNLAERAIRMPKVKQKIAGCLRAVEGAQAFATIRSYTDTLRKQGQDIFSSLRDFFAGNPWRPA